MFYIFVLIVSYKQHIEQDLQPTGPSSIPSLPTAHTQHVEEATARCSWHGTNSWVSILRPPIVSQTCSKAHPQGLPAGLISGCPAAVLFSTKCSLTSPSPVTSVTSASMSFHCLPWGGSPQLLLFCCHLPSWRNHPFSGFSWSTYLVSYSLRSTPWLPLLSHHSPLQIPFHIPGEEVWIPLRVRDVRTAVCARLPASPR